jgi:hypothetical protein
LSEAQITSQILYKQRNQIIEARIVYIKSLEDEPGEFGDDITALDFSFIGLYQEVMDLVSLGLLLGDGKSLRRLAYWLRRYRNEDMLYEKIIAPAVPDPNNSRDKYFHEKPYTHLIDVFLVKTLEEATISMNEYLRIWHKSFEGCSWHGGRLIQNPGWFMPYYGYWSFESAAIAILRNIDDRTFRNHLLYPKDLADWARENNSIEKIRASLES